MTSSIETSESEALPWAPRGAAATAPAQPALETDAAPVVDKFKGDNALLVQCIQALLNLDARGALVPHGIGGHARDLLAAAACRLSPAAIASSPSDGTVITMSLPLGVDLSAFTITVSENRYADDITVQRAKQISGPPLWKACYRGSVLNQHGEWEYEPLPSSRTDEFLARCRFTSAERAIAAAQVAKEHLL